MRIIFKNRNLSLAYRGYLFSYFIVLLAYAAGAVLKMMATELGGANVLLAAICFVTACLLLCSSRAFLYLGKMIVFLAVVLMPFYPIETWLHMDDSQKVLCVLGIVLWEVYWVGLFYIIGRSETHFV